MNDMSFEQIKAITEKYGPVMEQLDRLRVITALGSGEYFSTLEKMKLAVADQFVSEVKKQTAPMSPQVSPSPERNDEV